MVLIALGFLVFVNFNVGGNVGARASLSRR
jgi:hypothetical protein